MKVGVCLTLAEDRSTIRDALVEGAKRAERIGFDGIGFSAASTIRLLPDPLIGLSIAAVVTEKIALGRAYQVPLRNPVSWRIAWPRFN